MSAVIGAVSVIWNSAAIHAEPPRPLLRVILSTAATTGAAGRLVSQRPSRISARPSLSDLTLSHCNSMDSDQLRLEGGPCQTGSVS